MGCQRSSIGTRNVAGIILILIGGLYFLRTLDIIDFNVPHIIFSFPFFLFIIGIIITINSRNKLFGSIVTFLGAFFLFPRIFPFINYRGDIIVPVLLIALGVYIIFKQKIGNGEKTFTERGRTRADILDDVAIFGGGTKIIASDNFKGGNITAIFGGSEIDLTGCKLAEGDNVIDVLAIFGGTTLIVPRDWNVVLQVTPLFGGFSNKIKRDPGVTIDQTRKLVIKGLALFGGGEIRSYY